MIKLLIKIRLKEIFSSFVIRNNKKKQSPAILALIAFLMLYLVVVFLGMFGFLFYSVCVPFVEIGQGYLYFSFAALMGFFLCFIGSVFIAQTQLFDSKDNEFLLSMPVKTSDIIASRMFSVLLVNYMYLFVVAAPAGVVYCMHYTPTVLGIVLFVAAFLLLPLLSMTLTCVMAYIISFISSKMRRKNIITFIFYFAFLGGYFVIYPNITKYMEWLVANGENLANIIKKVLFPLYHLGNAISEKSILSFVLYALCATIPFMLVYMLISKNFIKIATSKKGIKTKKYGGKVQKDSSPFFALMKKEIKYFFSVPTYFLNAGIASVILIVLPVFLYIKKDTVDTLLQIPIISEYQFGIATLIICMLASMNMISAASISLEGKRIWLPLSYPVTSATVLNSKTAAHIMLTLPSVLFASISMLFMFDFGVWGSIQLILIPTLVTVLFAQFGTYINVLLPKLEWSNEAIPVKQGMSTLISMLSSMGLGIVAAAIYVLLVKTYLSLTVYMWILAAVLMVFNVIFFVCIKNDGAKRFSQIVS